MPLNLNNEKEVVSFGKDSILVQNPEQVTVLPCGRVLDMTGYTAKTIFAGHVIITDGNGIYKPMPVVKEVETGVEKYGTLPEGFHYAGLLYHSMPTNKPAAAILVGALVNEKVLPYSIDAIEAAFLAACPQISFVADEPVDVPAGE